MKAISEEIFHSIQIKKKILLFAVMALPLFISSCQQEKEKPTFNYTKEIIESGQPTGSAGFEQSELYSTQQKAIHTFSKGIEVKG